MGESFVAPWGVGHNSCCLALSNAHARSLRRDATGGFIMVNRGRLGVEHTNRLLYILFSHI